ncbi:MAG: AMP-binding protein, partial [bacterium]|nr:AMP-binding protein [bacterium]
VMFVLQNAPRGALEFSGLTLTPMPTEAASAKFDLTLTLEERASGIGGSFEYNTDLFDDVTIRRLAAHFAALLAAVARDPARPVAEVALVSASEHHQLCREWNGGWTGGRSDAPLGWAIDERFSAWAGHAPDAVAVTSGREVVSYGELDRRVDRVARRLKALGVGPEVRVGLCVERSVALPVAVLGVVRSGGAYLPLDPAYPEDRLVTMYEDAGAALLVTDVELHGHFSATLAGKAVRKLLIDDQRPAPEAAGALPYADPDHLAYTIYTSGSTGRPKGVEISHRALINFLEAMRRDPGLGS